MKYLVLGTQEGRLDYHDQGCSLQPFRDPLHGKELLGSLIRLTGAGPGEGEDGGVSLSLVRVSQNAT